MEVPILNCIFLSRFFRKKVLLMCKDLPTRHLCTCQDLLNEALNQKKCKNEKSIKLIFTYEKVILDYHNVLFNSKTELKKLNGLLKK